MFQINYGKIKCSTKSCQRSKNILPSSFCNSCSEASRKDDSKQKVVSNLKVTVQEMETIYAELKKGEVVDQNSVQRIIMGGILNFITQKDATATEKLEAKVFELEADLKTSKCRIESLGNWMRKSDDALKSANVPNKDGLQCFKKNVIFVTKHSAGKPHG